MATLPPLRCLELQAEQRCDAPPPPLQAALAELATRRPGLHVVQRTGQRRMDSWDEMVSSVGHT